MYICDNSACKLWLHKDCIIDDVLKKAYQESVIDSEAANGTARSRKSVGKPSYVGTLSGKIIQEEGGVFKVEITNAKPERGPARWQENVRCPKCQTEVHT